ncbi:hypothetical protein AN404_06220 [Pediococcus acidilactici]|nr:hypothetical protein AN404_06220 [Pediococcus acidilactici]
MFFLMQKAQKSLSQQTLCDIFQVEIITDYCFTVFDFSKMTKHLVLINKIQEVKYTWQTKQN